jgi:COP9 signalosome complex subunit 5
MKALINMLEHSKSGGAIEVMGLLQGKVRDSIFYISDCFRLPVEGTETRVNAGESANEYMVQYIDQNDETQFTNDSVCGWYHSHPGYGCWLSGIDVDTQSLYQSHQEPFVAIVIDPVRTTLTGKVEIGAFRALPRPDANRIHRGNTGHSIPKDKVVDFGAHCHRYYSLEVEVFKSSRDTEVIEKLWGSYWTESLKKMNFDAIQRESAESIRDALLADDGRVENVSNRLYKCACSRLQQRLQDYMRSNTLNSFSDCMDISP